jgi:hypothetical protein
MANERRRIRSNDARKALAYQLAYVRDEACLDALVLADKDGLIVARAGDPALCESLAAFAPLVSHGKVRHESELPATYLQVRPVEFEGTRLYLASCTESLADTLSQNLDGWLEHTQRGVTRILAAA